MIRALGEMKQPEEAVRWEHSGTRGIGVLVSDTMMFQRADPNPSDPNLGSFYGLAMPLLKRGIPVEPVQIESATSPGFLDRYRLLLLTYEGQKPPTPAFHEALGQWVRAGGALVVLDNDRDPYCAVREWWNTPPSPMQPRVSTSLKVRTAQRRHRPAPCGQGGSSSRSAVACGADLSSGWRGSRSETGSAGCRGCGLELEGDECASTSAWPIPHCCGAGRSIPNAASFVLQGRFIDLFDAQLPVRIEVTLFPSKRALLFDLDAIHPTRAQVVAAACQVSQTRFESDALEFNAEGVADTEAVVRILAPGTRHV